MGKKSVTCKTFEISWRFSFWDSHSIWWSCWYRAYLICCCCPSTKANTPESYTQFQLFMVHTTLFFLLIHIHRKITNLWKEKTKPTESWQSTWSYRREEKKKRIQISSIHSCNLFFRRVFKIEHNIKLH